MIAYLCFYVLVLLAFRSMVLLVLERKSWLIRIWDLLLAFFFGACAFLVILLSKLTFSEDLQQLALTFVVVALPTLSFLILRLRRPYTRSAARTGTKFVLLLLVLVLTLLVLMMSGFLNLTEDEPVLKITMTGNHQQEFVEWKPPQGTLQSQDLTAYEVVLDTPDGQPVSRLHVYGDQVAIKAKVIRFRPILNVIGFPNLCRIEYVYNGYNTAERFNSYPHHAQEIPLTPEWIQPWQKRFWMYWESSYYQRSERWWLKSATLESNYFPLVNPDGTPFTGSYFLTVTSGGLSSVPLP